MGKLGGKINLLGIEFERQQGAPLFCNMCMCVRGGSTEIADKFIENDCESECQPGPQIT